MEMATVTGSVTDTATMDTGMDTDTGTGMGAEIPMDAEPETLTSPRTRVERRLRGQVLDRYLGAVLGLDRVVLGITRLMAEGAQNDRGCLRTRVWVWVLASVGV